MQAQNRVATHVTPAKKDWTKRSFSILVNFLRQVPSIESNIGFGTLDNGCWWIKLSIDIENKLAWNVVQEFGYVLNYISLDDRLPTLFIPVSPPPYMNGGPKEFLSWIIESKSPDFSPNDCKKWLMGHLPQPVNDLSQWLLNTEADE